MKLYINDQLVDMYSDEDIVQTISVGDFSNIGNRPSSYSNSISVPATANNRAVFGHSEEVLSSTSVIYARNKAQVFESGVLVMNGFAEIESSGNSFSIRIYALGADFYSAIKGKSLQGLDFSSLNFERTLNYIVSSRLNTEGVIYPLIDYNSEEVSSYFPQNSRTVDSRTLFQAVFVHTIMDKIASEAGYTLSGDVITNENYLSLVIPFTNDDLISSQSGSEEDEYLAIKTATQTVPNDGNLHVLTFTNDSTGGGFNDGGNYNSLDTYTAPYDMYVKFICEVNINNPAPVPNNFSIGFRSGAGFGSPLPNTISGTAPIGLSTHIIDTGFVPLAAGTIVRLFMSVSAGGLGTPIDVDVDSFSGNDISREIIDVSANLPDINQGNFFKSIAQKFGGIVQVNNQLKTIEVNGFDAIISNKSLYKDWSSLVDETQPPQIKFKLNGYAQSNKFTYLDDPTVFKIAGTDYNLEINNENLEGEKELIQSVFSATRLVERLEGLNTSKIPRLLLGAFENAVEPKILVLNKVTVTGGNIVYSDPNTTDSTSVNTFVPLVRFYDDSEVFNLDWTFLVNTYYINIRNILQNTRMLTLDIRLSGIDITDMDFMIPVWIEKYKCFFYINKINQFSLTKRQSTEVELIKLP